MGQPGAGWWELVCMGLQQSGPGHPTAVMEYRKEARCSCRRCLVARGRVVAGLGGVTEDTVVGQRGLPHPGAPSPARH